MLEGHFNTGRLSAVVLTWSPKPDLDWQVRTKGIKRIHCHIHFLYRKYINSTARRCDSFHFRFHNHKKYERPTLGCSTRLSESDDHAWISYLPVLIPVKWSWSDIRVHNEITNYVCWHKIIFFYQWNFTISVPNLNLFLKQKKACCGLWHVYFAQQIIYWRNKSFQMIKYRRWNVFYFSSVIFWGSFNLTMMKLWWWKSNNIYKESHLYSF